MDYGANPHQKNNQQKTPFELACEKGDSALAIAMVVHPNFSLPDNFKEMILFCVTYQKTQLLQAILENAKREQLNFDLNTIVNAEKQTISSIIAKQQNKKEERFLILIRI